jgi:hypothetical protein
MTDDEIILHYMLWGFDETPYRVLRNAMVTTRKPSTCAICGGDIPVGSRVRAQTEVYDGDCKTFKLCPTCAAAVVADRVDGDCLRMEERTQIGMRRGGALSPVAREAQSVDVEQPSQTGKTAHD